MKIRKARKGDLKEVTNLFITEFGKDPYNEKWKYLTAYKKIKHYFSFGKIYVLELEKLIGFMIIHYESWPEGKTASIDEFVIKDTFQGKGYGTRFMKFVETKLKKEGVVEIRLWTSIDAKAFDFYKKRGYADSKKSVLFKKELK